MADTSIGSFKVILPPKPTIEQRIRRNDLDNIKWRLRGWLQLQVGDVAPRHLALDQDELDIIVEELEDEGFHKVDEDRYAIRIGEIKAFTFLYSKYGLYFKKGQEVWNYESKEELDKLNLYDARKLFMEIDVVPDHERNP